jgi:hypothetical protein
MADRFLCSEPEVGDLSFADVESILDALEAALVSSETPLFDSVRQSWQPVGLHPEVRSAWEARERYRPPNGSRLTLPALPATSAVEVNEITLRRAAYARVRAVPQFENADDAPVPKRPFVAFAVACLLVLLGIVGWAVLTFAVRLSALAGGLFAINAKR